MKNNKYLKNQFHYFASPGKFYLSDIEMCACSDRTFDLKIFDIANNEPLINLLHLYYLQGNFGTSYDYESRAQWFCGYLSDFEHDIEKSKAKRSKLFRNPTVRLLVHDNELLTKVKSVL